MNSSQSPFYENGLLRFKGEYLEGKMHSYWEFYRKDGSLMRSGHFERDRQVGEWKTFARDGRLVKTTQFGEQLPLERTANFFADNLSNTPFPFP